MEKQIEGKCIPNTYLLFIFIMGSKQSEHQQLPTVINQEKDILM